ncbi:hypothetical protein L1887_18204 [Cichorium endivia]|nr:hypothetical protein L1887_18204 [Cichorium endivia]
MAGGESFKIGVVEYTDDWSPFKPCSFDKVVESDDEEQEEETDDDSEGVSDTWMANMQDDDAVEDGEFRPGSADKEGGMPDDDKTDSPTVNMGKVNDVSGGQDFEASYGAENQEIGITDDVSKKDDFKNNGAQINTKTGTGEQNHNPTTQLPPLGCFGPFPSLLGSPMGNTTTGTETVNIQFMGYKDKRRRIASNDSTHLNSHPTTPIAPSNPLDLNNVPKNAAQSSEFEQDDMSIDSAEAEVRATMDVGRRIGFQMEDANVLIGACGEIPVEINGKK